MSEERFLITGALGCIGAWTTYNLVKQGIEVVAFDLGNDPHRMQLIMDDDELEQVSFVQGDITDLDAFERLMKDHGITCIIHLAALQVPFCRADPSLGARVNVVGTVNVFEAAKRSGIDHVVYASSIAVYGSSEEYPEGDLAHDAIPKPNNHYGVYKLANEGTARIYWRNDGISSIGLRPYIVYGPARDQGLTSDPSKAILAAVAGQPYHIGFGGTSVYQYASDTADAFIHAVRTPVQGTDAYNLGGHSVHMSKLVASIEKACPSAVGTITFDDIQLSFPKSVDSSTLETTFGEISTTSLEDGVAQSVEIYRKALADGKLSVS